MCLGRSWSSDDYLICEFSVGYARRPSISDFFAYSAEFSKAGQGCRDAAAAIVELRRLICQLSDRRAQRFDSRFFVSRLKPRRLCLDCA
jgi:hypothetical protein